MDLEDDATAGFDLISTWDLDEHGVDWITKKVRARVGTGPVVISLDVDVMDPSMVPASTFLSLIPFPFITTALHHYSLSPAPQGIFVDYLES